MKNALFFALSLLFLSAGGETFAQEVQKDSSITFLYNAIKSESDASRMEPLVVKMQKKIAGDKSGADQVLLAYSQVHLAESFAEEGNVEKTHYWINNIDGIAWKESAVLSSSQSLAEAGKTAEAKTLLKPYLSSSAIIPPKADPMAMMGRTPRSRFYGVYGIVLYKNGEFKKVLDYLAPADSLLQLKSAEVKEYYAMALIGAGKDDQVAGAIKDAVCQKGERSDQFMDTASKYFLQHYGTAKMFDDMVAAAFAERKEKAITKMAAYKINQPAPAFTISDVNGKQVSLSSLKGKTVILDFWATWCVPCVGSFPGMQRAVNYYAKDSTVVFLFIHTAERSSMATAEARRLITNRKYNFDLYMDLKDSLTHKNPMMDAFGVNALPTKFVINKEGIIKFKNTGFLAVDEAIDEISAMVELANKP